MEEKKIPILVSIQCFVYNHEPYLRQCLDGFVMQKTDFPFEAIVHDDCSTDGSAAIIKEYAEKYPDIVKPIYETENQYSKGDGSLRRIMNEACRGKYIAICEGDDYWTDPFKLQKQVEVLELHTECTICYGRVTTIDRNGYPKDRVFPNRNVPFIFSLKDFITMEFLEGSWVFQTSSFLYRRDIMVDYSDALRTRFKNFPHGDLIIQLFCLEKGKGYYISDTVSCYRMDSGGYNSYAESHPEFAIKQYEKKVNGLKDYDKATNYIFHYELQIGILGIELENEKRKNSRFGFFRKKYLILYKEKGMKETIIMFMNYYTPKFLCKLIKVKRFFYGKN